jgi:hypothetical protein
VGAQGRCPWLVGPAQRCGHVDGDRPGRGRQQDLAATFGAAADPQPRCHRDETRTVYQAQQQRLRHFHAAQPPALDCGGAGGEQPAADVDGALGGAGEAKPPERQDVPGGGEHRDERGEAERRLDGQQRGTRVVQVIAHSAYRGVPVRVEVSLVDDPPRQSGHGQQREEAGQGERSVADPGRVEPGQFQFGRPRRHQRRCIGGRRTGGWARVPVQNVRAQLRGLLRAQAVQGEVVFLLGVRASGPEPYPGEPHQPVQQRGLHVHRPDPVERNGHPPSAHQPGAQLDLRAGDAVTRRRPTRCAGERRDARGH